MKSSRLSSGRSREQCPHKPPFYIKMRSQKWHAVISDTQCPRMRKTAIRLAWDEETPGAAPGCATNFQTINQAPVAEQTPGIRLLNGTTQVQLLPGAVTYQFPCDVKVAYPFVKRVLSWCESTRGSHFLTRSASGQSRKLSRKTAAPYKVSGVQMHCAERTPVIAKRILHAAQRQSLALRHF